MAAQGEIDARRIREGDPVEVAALLGSSQVAMAVTCLGSLRRYSAEPVRLRIHDDGSLTAADRDRLAAGLGNPEILSREEADDLVGRHLAGRPACRAFRQRNPLALKLLDVPLLATGEAGAYCDSDVLFLRPFRRLFHFPSPAAGATFMADRQNAYSVRSLHLLRYRRLRLPQRVNTGIVHFRTATFDLDAVEWFLGLREFGSPPVWVEQTCWAFLGRRVGCWLLDPEQVRIPATREPRRGDPVALHLVSPVRLLLETCLAAPRPHAASPPIELRYLPARPCTALTLAGTEIRRRVARLLRA